LQGVLPFAPSLDHAGLLTRTVEDMIFLWKALGNDALERPAEWRLAFVPWPPDGGLEAEMSEAMNACLERLRAGGAKVTKVVPPQDFIALSQATRTVMKYEGARFHAERFREHGEKIGAALAALVKEGLPIVEEEYRRALRVIESCRREMEGLSSEQTIWLTPAALGAAPEGLASTGDPRCNLPFTALGVPALALPFARSKKGLPLGLQLTAPPEREDLLLAAALACEKALGLPPR
jgi:Asp-tRNA(Asn)/Glu-tRNA(Gln) amidotransferase A subunit family amidase